MAEPCPRHGEYDNCSDLLEEIAALRADYERCPANGLKSHSWNHINHDWIVCSLCGAKMPSRMALSDASPKPRPTEVRNG